MQQTAQLPPSAAPAAPAAPAPAEPVDIFLTHLPANLRAKFGRAQCRRLLADQSEVQRVWSQLEPVVPLSAAADGSHGDQTTHQHRGGRQPPRLPPLKHHNQNRQSVIKQQDWYSVLSEQFNSDYSAGVTMPRRFGHTQETHGQAILERSPEFNSAHNDGVYKHRRDEFAAYNEVIHVERKFNNFWAEMDRQDQGAAPRPQEVVRKPAAVQQQLQPQSAPVSILVSAAGKSATSTATAKRVTISNGNEAAYGGGGGQKESLHRANTRTVQQREA